MDRKFLLEDRLFFYALILSLALHGLLIMALPGFKLIEKFEFSEWLEVNLLVLPEFQISAIQESTSLEEFSSETEQGQQAGESLVLSSPPLWLPERMNPIISETIPMRLTIPSDHLPDVAGPGSDMTSIGLDLESVDVAHHSLKSSGLAPPDIPWKPSSSSASIDTDNEYIDMQVSGEVANRKVIFRPPVPRPIIPVSGVVNLKFWVEPDGTIGKIVPLIRADPELERIAMEYIEKWRFESVSESIGVQTGTIPVRIRLH